MKVVLDSNILIEFFRDPSRREAFERKAQRPLLFLSSVVAMELWAGCRTTSHRSALAAFCKPFEKAGRVIAPDHAACIESGQVLAQLQDEGLARDHLRSITNDVLIAVTAARAGVVVITRNTRDFSKIAKFARVRCMTPD